MQYKIEYKNQDERQQILSANSDKTLIEEQNITEGNFLIFSDMIEVSIAEYEDLQNQIMILQGVI